VADDLHDFQNRTWLKPLVRPQVGKWIAGGAVVKTIPALLYAPVVTGIPTQGQTLACSTGIWSQMGPLAYPSNVLLDSFGNPLLDSFGNPLLDNTQPASYPFVYYFTYQWLRDGVPILGANENTYTLTAADVGHLISCEVIATNEKGSSPPGFSNTVGPIAATLGITGTPVVTTSAGVWYAGFTVAGTGGWRPYLFNLTAGYWPAGITMNARTGVVSGFVLGSASSQTGIVITVTDRYGLTASLPPFNITITGVFTLDVSTLDGGDRLG
jgi:hypothetical protein